MPMLQWAAITVGVSATSASPGSRPLAELTWRSALMESSLEFSNGLWLKSRSYESLDISEKSAVSYFLGMAQTQLTCALLLDIPTLVHLDTYLRTIGRPTMQSRPDFLGFKWGMGSAVAVEAKGRSNGFDDQLVGRAKAQAQRLPALTGLVSTAVASVAWFDKDGVWHALLVDPPSEPSGVEFKASAILAAHYLPVVRAAAASDWTSTDDDRISFDVPPIDLAVSMPTEVFEALNRSDVSWSEEALAEAGDRIGEILEPGTLTAEEHDLNVADDSYRGGDLVEVKLGPSWRERADGIG